MIEKRRSQESQLKNLYNLIKQDTGHLHKANWEEKTSKIIEKKRTEEKFEALKEQRKKFIDIRRKKLAEFLISEEEALRAEIIMKQETPEDVRRKMEAKLNVLKSEREKERLELVQRLQERRFYESADELRKNDSEAFAFACYLEQENQMLDKLRKREQEKEEEIVYSTLNQFDYNKKIELEKIQAEEKKKKIKDTSDFLDWQRRTQEENLNKEEELKQYEIQRLKEQWDKDALREEEEKMKNREVNKMVYRDIEDFNRKEEIEKTKRSELEKMKDRELIETILQKERALDDIDRKEKEKKVKEFQQNKNYLEYIMNQKKEAEAWMDKLAQIDADKQWQRTQEVWMKEEAARIELLKQEEEKQKIIKEREELDKEIKNYQVACEKIKEEDLVRRKKHQDDLKYQMAEKEKQRQKDVQDKLYEERAAKLWEMEYQKKIGEQRILHKQKLEEIKKRGMI